MNKATIDSSIKTMNFVISYDPFKRSPKIIPKQLSFQRLVAHSKKFNQLKFCSHNHPQQNNYRYQIQFIPLQPNHQPVTQKYLTNSSIYFPKSSLTLNKLTEFANFLINKSLQFNFFTVQVNTIFLLKNSTNTATTSPTLWFFARLSLTIKSEALPLSLGRVLKTGPEKWTIQQHLLFFH